MAGLGFKCTKKEINCPRFGYEFTYNKPGVNYSPNFDSILLGEHIILEASAPKSFFDEEKGYSVFLSENTIFGPLAINKLTNNPAIPKIGAIDSVELLALGGSLKKDTIQFSEGQLKGFRTAYWTSETDSFKLVIKVKPKNKGTFIIALNQQSNRDTDCALYKYFFKIKNPNQHLYLIESLYGYIPIDERAYCFKVY